ETLDQTRLEALVFHEIGHVVGIGTLWNFGGNGLIEGRGTSDPRYVGESGVFEYTNTYAGPGVDVPAANTGGPGTRDLHWRESVFDSEIMTGYSESPGTPQPVSRVTVGGLEDLGYVVDLGAADAYQLPACSPFCSPAAPTPGAPGGEGEAPMDRALDEPIWVVGPDGTPRRLGASGRALTSSTRPSSSRSGG
ncbi:MAG TPA: hypothetical protein VLL48_00845, partial [Longimicrobiales bacterium]|nr:hypothetical protein [Longimicrobiales bacterium]